MGASLCDFRGCGCGYGYDNVDLDHPVHVPCHDHPCYGLFFAHPLFRLNVPLPVQSRGIVSPHHNTNKVDEKGYPYFSINRIMHFKIQSHSCHRSNLDLTNAHHMLLYWSIILVGVIFPLLLSCWLLWCGCIFFIIVPFLIMSLFRTSVTSFYLEKRKNEINQLV